MLTIKSKKKLGQNFLIDTNKINEIINNIPNINKKDNFLEVGPGTGSLTKELLKKENNVIGIEIDLDLVNYLNENLKSKNLKLLNEDFLETNLDTLLLNFKEINFVSNLPYYISTKIIFKILKEPKIVNVSIMLQKELVERITAKNNTKSFGRLTVSINSFFTIEKIINVSRECFKPIPNVDSNFLVLKKKEINIDHDKYLDFIKKCFANKRKTILNSLKNQDQNYYLKLKNYFEENQISDKKRAEEISINEYLTIWNDIK